MNIKPLVIGLVCLLATVPVFAQTAEEIVDRHVAAIGGEAKLKSLQTVKYEGTFSMPAFNLEMSYVLQMKRPNKMRIVSKAPGMEMVQAYDGSTAWMINPFMGQSEPGEMPEEQATNFANQALIDGFLVHREQNGITLSDPGEEELGGATYDAVTVTFRNGQSVRAYFDKEYGLLVATKVEAEAMGQTSIVITNYSDYRETDGILTAHRMDTDAGGQQFSITIDSAEYNVPVEDSVFEMPAQ